MDIIRQNLPLELARPSLSSLPDAAWPEGYSARWFRPGDAVHWLRIHHDAEPFHEMTPEVFLREFGGDLPHLGDCQCYVQDAAGRVVGTGTAWRAELGGGETWGRVFWLAVLRCHQGHGLGKPLLATVCQRLRELGHSRARVMTSTGRPAAVNLYLKFGFEPVLHSENDRVAWDAMFNHLRDSGCWTGRDTREPIASPPRTSSTP